MNHNETATIERKMAEQYFRDRSVVRRILRIHADPCDIATIDRFWWYRGEDRKTEMEEWRLNKVRESM